MDSEWFGQFDLMFYQAGRTRARTNWMGQFGLECFTAGVGRWQEQIGWVSWPNVFLGESDTGKNNLFLVSFGLMFNQGGGTRARTHCLYLFKEID